MLVLVGLMDTSMASKGSRGHRGQERRTTSCSSVRIFNQRLQACLKDARKQIRMLDEDKNESMKTIKELEIKNQNLDVEAKKCDAEKHNCMVNSDILEGENKRLKEQIECKFWPKGYKTFIMLNSAETEFILLIHVKMTIIVSRINDWPW